MQSVKFTRWIVLAPRESSLPAVETRQISWRRKLPTALAESKIRQLVDRQGLWLVSIEHPAHCSD